MTKCYNVVGLYQFIQTPVFSSLLDKIGEDELLEAIEAELSRNPSAGSLIKGGMRKVRVASTVRAGGKSGGYRVWYFFDTADDVFYLLFLLDKRESADLTAAQQRFLADELHLALGLKRKMKG